MIITKKRKIISVVLAGVLCFSNIGLGFGMSNNSEPVQNAIHYDIYDDNGNLVLSNSNDPLILQQTFKAKIQSVVDEIEASEFVFHHVGVYEPQKENLDFGIVGSNGTITINVKDTSAPVVLSLTAYEQVNWKITMDPDVVLNQVILSGYYKQTIEGIDANKVIIGTYEGGNNDFFNIYQTDLQGKEMLNNRYGRIPNSFQGAYSGSTFDVVASIPSVETNKSIETFKSSTELIRDSKSTGTIRMIGSTTNNGMTCIYGGYGASTTSMSDKGHLKGKYYFEMKLNLDRNVEPDTWTWAGLIGSDGDKNFAYQLIDTWGRGVLYPEDLKDGDIIGIAIDLNNHIGYASLNNQWKTGLPDSNNGFNLTSDLTYHAGASCSASSSSSKGKEDSWTAAFKVKNLKYETPAGYSAFEY